MLFNDWKIRDRKYRSKGLSCLYNVIEKVLFRELKINDMYKIEEGVIIDYKEKNLTMKEKEYKNTQQHLIGYHYISVIDKYNQDVFWIQGNIKSKSNEYAIFHDKGRRILLNWCNSNKAFKKFFEIIKNLFNIEIEYNIKETKNKINEVMKDGC